MVGSRLYSVRVIAAILRKDLLLDYRSPIYLTTQAIFSLAAGILGGVIQRSAVAEPTVILPVSLSIVLVFLSIYASYSSFLREREQGTIDGLRLSPVGPEILFVSKLIYTSISILLFSLIFLLSLTFFTGASIPTIHILSWIAVSSILMGGIASLSSSMMVYSSSHATLTPVLIIVLSLPYFQASSTPIQVLSQGYMPPPGWLSILLLYAAGFNTISSIIIRYILE